MLVVARDVRRADLAPPQRVGVVPARRRVRLLVHAHLRRVAARPAAAARARREAAGRAHARGAGANWTASLANGLTRGPLARAVASRSTPTNICPRLAAGAAAGAARRRGRLWWWSGVAAAAAVAAAVATAARRGPGEGTVRGRRLAVAGLPPSSGLCGWVNSSQKKSNGAPKVRHNKSSSNTATQPFDAVHLLIACKHREATNTRERDEQTPDSVSAQSNSIQNYVIRKMIGRAE